MGFRAWWEDNVKYKQELKSIQALADHMYGFDQELIVTEKGHYNKACASYIKAIIYHCLRLMDVNLTKHYTEEIVDDIIATIEKAIDTLNEYLTILETDEKLKVHLIAHRVEMLRTHLSVLSMDGKYFFGDYTNLVEVLLGFIKADRSITTLRLTNNPWEEVDVNKLEYILNKMLLYFNSDQCYVDYIVIHNRNTKYLK